MNNYVKDQKKITIYYDGHDYYDVPTLAIRAAKALVEKQHNDCITEYGESVVLYAKKNKSGITVRQI